MGFRNKKGGRVEKSSIEYILHNIAYIGKFYYDDILVENTDYPPIINESTFYLVQDKLNDPSKTRQTHTEYVYNNVVKCTKCGCALTGETHKKKLKDGSIKRYIHYHCTGNRGGECKKSSYIREELIEQAVVNLLKMITIPEDLVKEVANGLKEVYKLQGKDMETNKKSLRKRIDKIDKMIIVAFESGMYKNSESLQNTINKWETERRSLIIEEQEILKATKTFFDCSNLLLEFCKDCHSAYLGAMAKQKKQILKIVCSNFSCDGENLVIELNIAFKAVIKNSLNKKKLPAVVLDFNNSKTWHFISILLSQNLHSISFLEQTGSLRVYK